jgi:hypothetical protein
VLKMSGAMQNTLVNNGILGQKNISTVDTKGALKDSQNFIDSMLDMLVDPSRDFEAYDHTVAASEKFGSVVTNILMGKALQEYENRVEWLTSFEQFITKAYQTVGEIARL